MVSPSYMQSTASSRAKKKSQESLSSQGSETFALQSVGSGGITPPNSTRRQKSDTSSFDSTASDVEDGPESPNSQKRVDKASPTLQKAGNALGSSDFKDCKDLAPRSGKQGPKPSTGSLKNQQHVVKAVDVPLEDAQNSVVLSDDSTEASAATEDEPLVDNGPGPAQTRNLNNPKQIDKDAGMGLDIAESQLECQSMPCAPMSIAKQSLQRTQSASSREPRASSIPARALSVPKELQSSMCSFAESCNEWDFPRPKLVTPRGLQRTSVERRKEGKLASEKQTIRSGPCIPEEAVAQDDSHVKDNFKKPVVQQERHLVVKEDLGVDNKLSPEAAHASQEEELEFEEGAESDEEFSEKRSGGIWTPLLLAAGGVLIGFYIKRQLNNRNSNSNRNN